MRGPDFPILPRCRQASEEAFEVGVTMRKDVQHFTLCEPSDVLLDVLGDNYISPLTSATRRHV